MENLLKKEESMKDGSNSTNLFDGFGVARNNNILNLHGTNNSNNSIGTSNSNSIFGNLIPQHSDNSSYEQVKRQCLYNQSSFGNEYNTNSNNNNNNSSTKDGSNTKRRSGGGGYSPNGSMLINGIGNSNINNQNNSNNNPPSNSISMLSPPQNNPSNSISMVSPPSSSSQQQQQQSQGESVSEQPTYAQFLKEKKEKDAIAAATAAINNLTPMSSISTPISPSSNMSSEMIISPVKTSNPAQTNSNISSLTLNNTSNNVNSNSNNSLSPSIPPSQQQPIVPSQQQPTTQPQNSLISLHPIIISYILDYTSVLKNHLEFLTNFMRNTNDGTRLLLSHSSITNAQDIIVKLHNTLDSSVKGWKDQNSSGVSATQSLPVGTQPTIPPQQQQQNYLMNNNNNNNNNTNNTNYEYQRSMQQQQQQQQQPMLQQQQQQPIFNYIQQQQLQQQQANNQYINSINQRQQQQQQFQQQNVYPTLLSQQQQQQQPMLQQQQQQFQQPFQIPQNQSTFYQQQQNQQLIPNANPFLPQAINNSNTNAAHIPSNQLKSFVDHFLNPDYQNLLVDFKSCKLNDFKILNILGNGSFAFVRLCQHESTKRLFVMKILNQNKIIRLRQEAHVCSERDVLQMIDHRFIIKLYTTFKDDKYLYFLQEYIPGGELFDHIRSKKQLSVDVTRLYAAEIILALEYLHGIDIIYRDLKPENLLIDLTGHIKLTDFGFAKQVKDNTKSMCGTPEYIAPEIIYGQGHGRSVDWWSLGILIYEMLVGVPPFINDGGENTDVFKLIREGHIAERIPLSFDENARDLIVKLVEVDVNKRLGCMAGGIRDIKSHPFFQNINWDAVLEAKQPGPLQPKIRPYNTLDDPNPNADDEIESSLLEQNIPMGQAYNVKKRKADLYEKF